jgi:hypothetical protein
MLRIAIFLPWICILILSCGEKLYTGDVNCSECYTPKPDTALLVVNLTINSEFTQVPLVVYRGDAEANDVEYVDTATISPYTLPVAVGKSYSVKATYKRDGKTLYAIDGTKIKVLLVTDACDQDCYVIRNESVNVEIRKKFSDF